jgi:hypothetical protein
MISAETMFYFSASIRVGRKLASRGNNVFAFQPLFESRLKALGAVSGKTLTITVLLCPSPPEIHL